EPVEELELRGGRGFELLSPSFEVFAPDGGRARPGFLVANLETSPELIDRRLQVVQFHRDTKGPRREPELVALLSSPEAVLQDHALAEGKQLLAEPPQSLLEAHAPLFVVVVDAEVVLPLVGAQAHGGELGRQLSGERR